MRTIRLDINRYWVNEKFSKEKSWRELKLECDHENPEGMRVI